MTVFDTTQQQDWKQYLQASPAYLDMLRMLQNETDQYYREFAPLKNTVQSIDRLHNPTPEDIFTVCEQEITREAIKPLIDFEMGRYISFPLYTSPMVALNTGAVTGWALINHPLFLVMLLAFDSAEFRTQQKTGKIKPVINFPAGDIALNILQSDGFTCSHWTAPEVRDDTNITAGLRCYQTQMATYQTGDRIFTRGGTQTNVYEDVASATVGIQVFCRIFRTNVMVDYDPVTHYLKTVCAADQRSSRIQLLNTVLRIFERQDGIPMMKEMLAHPDHFVRWQTARELVALSPQDAEPSLRYLAQHDRNQSVRQMASKTLDMFYRQEVS